MNSMVSVIVPVYNREHVLMDCIRSVQEQSYENWQIILIDDGSSDGSLELCRAAATQDTRILVIEADHSGVSGARNYGLEAAEGEYIFFLDSDDAIHPNLFKTMVAEMDRTKAAVAGTDVFSVHQKKWSALQELIVKEPDIGEMQYYDAESTVDALFRGGSPINLIGGVMMRKDWINETRFKTDLFIGEDYYFIYENIVKGADALFLKQKWYYNRIHTTNISWNYSYDAFWSRFYRRVLVWENEEKLGRTKYMKIQKKDAFGVINRCLKRNESDSLDSKKIRKVMRQYRKDIFMALSWKQKIMYDLAIHLPRTYLAIIKKR